MFSLGSTLLPNPVELVSRAFDVMNRTEIFRWLSHVVSDVSEHARMRRSKPVDTHIQTMEDTSDSPSTTDVDGTLADVDEVPLGWARLMGTDDYVRLLDSVRMDCQGARELATKDSYAVVKAEYHLSLPAIVKFYVHSVVYCTYTQASSLLKECICAMKQESDNGTRSVHLQFWSSLQFWTQGAKPVFLELNMHQAPGSDVKTSVSTMNSKWEAVDTYDELESGDEFPTLHQIMQHVPGIFEQMSLALDAVIRQKNDSMWDRTEQMSRLVCKDTRDVPHVSIRPSALNIETRKVVIELDSQEADLTAKLEEIRKRKRELEEASRNVRRSSTL